MQAHVIVLGYQQHVNHDALNVLQVTIRNAGHMVPHDHPLAARAMIETWVAGVLAAQPAARATSAVSAS